MARNRKPRESSPGHFPSAAEAAEFWYSHDLTNYWDQTREVEGEVEIQCRVFLTALEPELAKKLVACARKQRVLTETNPITVVFLSTRIIASGHRQIQTKEEQCS